MLEPDRPLALFMPGAFGLPEGKMGYGVLRYSGNPVACVIDPTHAGVRSGTIKPDLRDVPIVADVAAAAELGASALVLGTAPSGGRLPEAWLDELDRAIAAGMSIINGLHRRLAPRWPTLAAGQWVWDIRQEPDDLPIGGGRAMALPGRRLLMVGTDMAVGKMTVGLEVGAEAARRGIDHAFVATGQIGITITGRGVPLDAIRLDYASGAIEREVLAAGERELIVVEGQGSIINPASTATLPLLRGSCPTHLVLCHRLGMAHLKNFKHIAIPPLREIIALYEHLAEACGVFPAAKVVAVAMDTSAVDEAAARAGLAAVTAETGLPATDAVRFGAETLVEAVMSAAMPPTPDAVGV